MLKMSIIIFMQVFHQISCNVCGNLASRFCPECEKVYACDDHNQSHCGKSSLALITKITNEEFEKKRSQIGSLKKFLNDSKKKNIEDTENYIAKILQISSAFQAKLDEEFIKIENLEYHLNLTMNSYPNNYLDCDVLYLSRQNPNKIIKEQWIAKNRSLSEKIKESLALLEGKSKNPKESELKKPESDASGVGRIIKSGYSDLSPEALDKWKDIKIKIPKSSTDVFDDMINSLDDNKEKILTDRIKISHQISQVAGFNLFMDLLPIACPNLLKVDMTINPFTFENIIHSLSNNKKLIDLRLDFMMKQHTKGISDLLMKISTIKSLERLSLENAFFNDSEIKVRKSDMPNLKILELINNGISPENHFNLFEQLKCWNSIKYLKISKNTIKDSVVSPFENFLASLKKLEYLNLSENRCDISFQRIINRLINQQSVVELHLYMNEVPAEVWENSAESIKWPSLKKVVMGFGLSEKVVNSLANNSFDLYFKNNLLCIPYKDINS